MGILGFFGGETFKQRSVLSKGRTTGFDYLRIGLAIAVILVHAPETTEGAGAGWVWEGWHRPFVAAILPAFFALSGFLVTGSLQRSKTLVEFALLRALRIIPALFVEVIVAALILGPALTVLPLSQYFTDPKFYAYGLNVVGDIHFQLPGLFLNNPDPNTVNRQLWTIPSELRCYLILIVLAFLGVASRARWMVVLLAICIVGLPVIDVLRHKDLWAMDNVPGAALLLFFLAGVTANLLMEWLPLNWTLFGICVALSYVTLLFRPTAYFACVPLTYVTLFIGLSQIPKTFLTATGDYSYGVYLYGFPIQQTYAYLFPAHRIWWLSLLVTAPCILLLAWASWTFVESKVLQRRAWILGHVSAFQGHMQQTLRRRWPDRR
jgi:peptidoglycan/LPS O-acetylase OafA/YrhL